MKDVLEFLDKEISNSERLMKESEGKGEGHLHSYWMGRTDAFYTLKAMLEMIR